MALHARSVAVAAGAVGTEVERVAAAIVEARAITLDAATRVLTVIRTPRSSDRAVARFEMEE